MMIVIASAAVALVAFIIYALERKSKKEPIAWDQALKLSLFGGLLTAGVVFATTSDVTTVTETIKSVELPIAQDMFVGCPTF